MEVTSTFSETKSIAVSTKDAGEMSRIMRKPMFWFPTRSDTNRAVQLQKMARGLKFGIKKVEELYYLCSENKGADQLCGYREADLRLCFRIRKTLVFSRRGPNGGVHPDQGPVGQRIVSLTSSLRALFVKYILIMYQS